MGHRNNGQGEVNALQNRFTAYLLTAIRRKKRDYIAKQERINGHEFAVDLQAAQFPDEAVDTNTLILDLALMQALDSLTARERYILLERVVNKRRYDELASLLGLRYSGVSSAYHRIIHRLRKELGGRKA